MVAKRIGWQNGQFVSNIERGMALPPIPTIPTYAEYIGENPDELFQLVCQAELEHATQKYNEAKKHFEAVNKRRRKNTA